jgi:hypothetical protein
MANFSCKEKDLTCTAIIKVVRSIGGPAPSAKVTLTSEYGQLSETHDLDPALVEPNNTKITDANGEVSFTFKYPAILDIKVTHISFGTAEDLVKLEEGETVTKTVTLQ